MFGAPEYFPDLPGEDSARPQSERVCLEEDSECVLTSDSVPLPTLFSRVAKSEIVYDAQCQGASDPVFDCVAKNYARRRSVQSPQCWDRNDTVVGYSDCRDPETGTPQLRCLEVAFTSTAYVVQV